MPRAVGEVEADWRMKAKWVQVFFGDDENVLKFILVMIAQLCEYYTKSHWIVHFKWVGCMA